MEDMSSIEFEESEFDESSELHDLYDELLSAEKSMKAIRKMKKEILDT